MKEGGNYKGRIIMPKISLKNINSSFTAGNSS